MNHDSTRKSYAKLTIQINKKIAVATTIASVLMGILLPTLFTDTLFSLMVYSGAILLVTMPLDELIPILRIVIKLVSELLYLSDFITFYKQHYMVGYLFFGIASILLWLPIVGMTFTGYEDFWILLFLVYVTLWAVFFHAAALAETKEPSQKNTLELQKKHNVLFWIIWDMVFGSCLFGCVLLTIPYSIDWFCENSPLFTSMRVVLLSVSVTGLLLLAMIGVWYRRYAKKVRQTLENMQIQHQIEQNQMYITLLTDKYRSLQQYQHDFKKHLSYIYQLAVQRKSEEIAEYISIVQDDLQQGTLLRLTGNQTLDLLLSDYVQRAKSRGVYLQIQYQPQTNLARISAPDLCIILGNLLDNAIRASAESREKRVICEFGMKNEYYAFIQLVNSWICHLFC